MRRSTILLFFGFIMLAPPQLNAQAKSGRRYVSSNPLYKYNIDTAYSLLGNEKFKEAIPFLQAALDISDKSYGTGLKLADAFNKTGQTDKCFSTLQQLCNKHWDILSILIQQQAELPGFMFANLMNDKRWVDIMLCLKQKQQAYSSSKDSAAILMQRQNYKAAIPYLQTATQKEDDTHFYETQLAAAYNNTLQVAECFTVLNKIAADWDWMATYLAYDTAIDFEFANLVKDKRWLDLKLRVDSIATAQTAGHNRQLMAELKEIQYADQFYRNMDLSLSNPENTQQKIDSVWALQNEIDSINLLLITGIFDKYGYPGDSLVGNKYCSVGWLVIQHTALKYQEKYLPLIKAAADNQQLPWADVALLIDRVEMFNQRPQIYGSQINCDMHNNCTLYKISDEAHVNQRRAGVGLGPLQDYVIAWGIKWTPPAVH